MAPQPGIDAKLLLSLAEYAVIIVGITSASVTIIGVSALWRLGKDALEPAIHIFQEGGALRMLTVIVIVTAVMLLTALGKIEGTSAATILSGIVGYVLGGANTARHRKRRWLSEAGGHSSEWREND
jgi:hypothetical protein